MILSHASDLDKILVTGLANSADENKIACHKKSFQIKKEVYIYKHLYTLEENRIEAENDEDGDENSEGIKNEDEHK